MKADAPPAVYPDLRGRNIVITGGANGIGAALVRAFHAQGSTATKGGIVGFTRSLAREVGPKGIRVNTISPGWVMTKRQLKEFVTPAARRLIRKSQCIPAAIQPDEVAAVAVFLASRASGAITGQQILVDRGWTHS